MTTPATVATMTTTTTATCCNGHPSPLLQDNSPPVTPASATDRYAAYYQTYSKGIPCNPTDYHRIFNSRDASNTRGIKSRRRRWILTLSVACVLVVITSVVLSCLVMRYLLVQGGGVDGQKPVKMCVFCDPKSPHKQMPSSGEGAVCCAADEAKMDQLIVEGVRLSLQDRLKGQELYALLNNPLLPPPINKDAAHVFFRPTRRSKRPKVDPGDRDQSENDNVEILRDWNSDGESAFIRSGIEFNATKGHFRVKNTGIYVVYSRIVYENAGGDVTAYDDDDVTGDDDVRRRFIFGHSIVSYHRSQYRPLLEDEQTMECDVNTVCYNSKVFSTLHLTKDSQLAIRVLQAGFISPRSHASYFGLYKID